MEYKKICGFGCLALALFAGPVWSEVKGVAYLGYEVGGENLVDVTYTEGPDSSINAGDGILIAGGVAYLFNPEFAVQATIGWKGATTRQASNGEVTFTRFPVETLAQYTKGKARLGGGVTYHLNPELDGSGDLSAASVSFDDAVGTVLQLDYVTEIGLVFGVRYTNLSYTVNGTDFDVDANSIGIHMTGRL